MPQQIVLLVGNRNKLTFLSKSSTSIFPPSIGRDQCFLSWILDKTIGLLVLKHWHDKYEILTIWWTKGTQSHSSWLSHSHMHACIEHSGKWPIWSQVLFPFSVFSLMVRSCVWFLSYAPLWSTYSGRELTTSRKAFCVASQLIFTRCLGWAGVEARIGKVRI